MQVRVKSICPTSLTWTYQVWRELLLRRALLQQLARQVACHFESHSIIVSVPCSKQLVSLGKFKMPSSFSIPQHRRKPLWITWSFVKTLFPTFDFLGLVVGKEEPKHNSVHQLWIKKIQHFCIRNDVCLESSARYLVNRGFSAHQIVVPVLLLLLVSVFHPCASASRWMCRPAEWLGSVSCCQCQPGKSPLGTKRV